MVGTTLVSTQPDARTSRGGKVGSRHGRIRRKILPEADKKAGRQS